MRGHATTRSYLVRWTGLALWMFNARMFFHFSLSASQMPRRKKGPSQRTLLCNRRFQHMVLQSSGSFR